MSTFYTIKEAAKTLKVSEQRVRTLCRDGELEAEKVGTNWLIDCESLSEYSTSSSDKVPQDHKSSVKKNNKPIVLSFFSGAMGLDQGLEEVGFDIRLACEIDKYCRQTIELN